VDNLRRGDVFVIGYRVKEDSPRYRVLYVNDSRALVEPVEKKTIVIGDATFQRSCAAVSISPNSAVTVVAHQRLPKDTVKLPKVKKPRRPVRLRRRLPRAPLPRQRGGAHKDKRRPARVNARVHTRKEAA